MEQVPSCYKDILIWFVSGEATVASMLMSRFMLNALPHDWQWKLTHLPQDAADFGSCLKALEIMPRWLDCLPDLAEHSAGWAGLVAHWDELTQLYHKEVGNMPLIAQRKLAPRFMLLMKQKIAQGYLADPRYVVRLYPDDTIMALSKVD